MASRLARVLSPGRTSIAAAEWRGWFGARVSSIEWGKCISRDTLQAVCICNWLESALLEGMLADRERGRVRGAKGGGREGEERVTGGEGKCTLLEVDI